MWSYITYYEDVYIITFFARLTATTWPSGKVALYTVPNPPSPNFSEDEKLCVAFVIWLTLRCTDPIRHNWGDSENRDGLGGTLGVAGIFSVAVLNSNEEAKSTANKEDLIRKLNQTLCRCWVHLTKQVLEVHVLTMISTNCSIRTCNEGMYVGLTLNNQVLLLKDVCASKCTKKCPQR